MAKHAFRSRSTGARAAQVVAALALAGNTHAQTLKAQEKPKPKLAASASAPVQSLAASSPPSAVTLAAMERAMDRLFQGSRSNKANGITVAQRDAMAAQGCSTFLASAETIMKARAEPAKVKEPERFMLALAYASASCANPTVHSLISWLSTTLTEMDTKRSTAQCKLSPATSLAESLKQAHEPCSPGTTGSAATAAVTRLKELEAGIVAFEIGVLQAKPGDEAASQQTLATLADASYEYITALAAKLEASGGSSSCGALEKDLVKALQAVKETGKACKDGDNVACSKLPQLAAQASQAQAAFDACAK